MNTNETHMVAFRRARKHRRTAWGHQIGVVRVNVPPREPVEAHAGPFRDYSTAAPHENVN